MSITEVVYHSILDANVGLDPSSSRKDEVDPILDPIWVVQSSCSLDLFDDTLPSDEAILEAMSGLDSPWDDMHHQSYFLSKLVRI